jgi:cytochrome c551/c552
MKCFSLALLGVFLAVSISFGAEDGATQFKSLGCTSCHKPEKSTRINPSLKEIAKVYQGKQDQLADYLNGQQEALVRPEKASLMKRYIEKTKALTDDQRSALAAFILGYQ